MFLIKLWPTVVKKTNLENLKLNSFRDLFKNSAEIAKTAVLPSKPSVSWHHDRCIKQAPQLSILTNDSYLREFDVHETSNKTSLIKQTLVVRETLCSPWDSQFLIRIKIDKIILNILPTNIRMKILRQS